MNGKEMFNKIYDGELKEDECIQVLHPQEENHYLMRNANGDFDKNELFRCLLFKDYKFDIIKQEDAIKTLKEKSKQEEIERLEARLKELKGENIEEQQEEQNEESVEENSKVKEEGEIDE